MSTDRPETPEEIEAAIRRRDAVLQQARTVTRSVQAASSLTLEAAMSAIGEVISEQQKKLRAEFEARLDSELLKIRNEFLQDRLDQERGVKRKASPLPVHSIVELN